MNTSTRQRIALAEEAIRATGYELRYVKFCEDAETPGIWPGLYAGITDSTHRAVKIKREVRSVILAEVLEHELHHVLDYARGLPGREHTWCGNHFSLTGGLVVGSRVHDPGRQT